jgi:type I restriction-modification system DNA methylase subunit
MSKSHELSTSSGALPTCSGAPIDLRNTSASCCPWSSCGASIAYSKAPRMLCWPNMPSTRENSQGDALDSVLNKISGQRFHNHSPLSFEKLKGDPDNAHLHLVSYINGFSENVRKIFERFDFGNEIERMREHNILFLVIKKFCEVDLHPSTVDNIEMGLLFEDLIRRFNEQANETAGDHFTPREVIRLMVSLLFMHDDDLLRKPGTVRKMLDPTCGTGGMLSEARKYLREHQAGAQAVCVWPGLQPAILCGGSV